MSRDDTKALPRGYHHGNLRAALIEAGLAALEQAQTVSDLSLRAIAREVGVSANAAYRHFASKDELLGALAAEGFRRFAARQQAAVQACSDTAGVPAATAKAYVGFAQAHPALFRLMFSHFLYASGSADLKEAASAAFGQLLQLSASRAGVPADSQTALVHAIANWSMVHGLSHLLLDGQLAPFEAAGLGAASLIDQLIALRYAAAATEGAQAAQADQADQVAPTPQPAGKAAPSPTSQPVNKRAG